MHLMHDGNHEETGDYEVDPETANRVVPITFLAGLHQKTSTCWLETASPVIY